VRLRAWFGWIPALVAIGVLFFPKGVALAAPPPTGVTSGAINEAGLVAVPEVSERALRFYQTGNLAWAVETVWDLAIPAVLFLGGWAAGLQRRVEQSFSGRRAKTGVYWLLFAGIFGLADFPVLFARQYWRPHWFGLSDQPFLAWGWDVLKASAVGAGLGLLAVWAGFYAIRRFPRRWWLAGGLAMLPVTLALTFLEPVVLEPLFNKFEPLGDRGLEAKVRALAKSAGLEHPVVYQVNKSRQTKALNAYVSGLFGSSRIVLWDTLLAGMTEREILSVVGHEIGHRVLDHIWKSMLVFWGLGVLGLWMCQKGAEWILSRWGPALRLTSLTEPAAIGLFVSLLLAAEFVLDPVGLAYSRHIEAEADRFGLELTRDNHAGATAELKLGLQNLANPRPDWWYMILRASHPSNASRIEFFNTYKPWAAGEPLRYGDLIHGDP
jgi:Zn-dependent protease with chaperone function